MGYWLGINEDLFDAGVALCSGEEIIFAANEERYSRRKNEGGFPYRSMEGLFRYTGIDPADIEHVCMTGFMTPPLPVRMFPRSHDWIFESRRKNHESASRKFFDDVTFYLPVTHTSETSLLRRSVMPFLAPVTRRNLPKALRKKPLSFVEHHVAHAAGAWHFSGFEECLCMTIDGMGDGLSLTVATCRPGEGMKRLWTVSSRDSIGLYFQVMAEVFGFVSCRDEGKITGLAANGDPAAVKEPSPFTYTNGELKFHGRFGQRGIEQIRRDLASKYSREDLAAWVQHLLEVHVVEIAREWLQKTGMRKLAVSGGVVANVKLNQRLHELEECDELFVFPNMGDGGLNLGAICHIQGKPHHKLSDVFLGESYSDAEIEAQLKRLNVPYARQDDLEHRVAELLAEDRIVCRYYGRMEYGPRALGNRSILARTTDRNVVKRLNSALRRNDFMPFAPAVLDDVADDYVIGANCARHAAEFMTVCFDCTDKMKELHPAIVHVDGTARAQLVRQETNPTFHKILKRFGELSGSPVLLNTSFNIHEEPIIQTPEEAVRAFLTAELDYLAAGPFLASSEALKATL
jgi:carbamoyltransferase